MRELAQSNLAEIETGKVALSQSKNEQVRNFAQRMIDDHTQAQQELSQLAQAKGVTLPAEPDSKHKTALKKLAALQGDQFDKKYIAQGGLNDHRETHRLLQRTQSLATDPDLKALATKMTSVVDQHLTMAEEVGNAKTSSGASGTTSGTGQSGVSGSPGSGKQ
ncbi:DUF4142 domain-containing protein [Herbaspirillum sp. HC18]|nr:DUF4142 domain-containing protein [Herbaspirillum sp. HC18]